MVSKLTGPAGIWRRLLRVITAHVAEQADFNAEDHTAAIGANVRRHFLILPDADHVKLDRADVVFGCQLLHHRIGAAIAEVVVIFFGAGGISSTGNFENVALGAAELSSEAIQLIFGVSGECGLVKAEVH